MKKLKALIKLIRPFNSFMIGLGVIVGFHISNSSWINSDFNLIFGKIAGIYFVILAFLVGFLISSFSMILNDYADYLVDLINSPNKPLPSKLISKKSALIFALIFVISGFLISILFLNIVSIFLVLSGIIISFLYNFYLKKKGIIGNAAVAYSTALPFLYGGSLANFSNFLPILILSLLAFLSNLSREIIKGISDIKGDVVMGIKTIANTYGESLASKISFAFIFLAVILSLIPIIFFFSIFYIIFITIADFIFIYSCYVLVKNPTKKTSYKIKNNFLIAMFIALIGFLISFTNG